ncbi:MAG TPA: Ig-like domain-containing protein [Mycobacteriales bacterium]|nr:Ig-like domain-containing protein [Mycobacteriales bacterium]
MRFAARAVAASTTSLLLVALVPGTAHAATVASSTPADNAQLTTMPATISVTFDGPIAPGATLTVTPPVGDAGFTCPANTQDTDTVSCDPAHAGLFTEGTYTLTYSAQVVSLPPGTVSGTRHFVLDRTAPAAPTGLAFSPAPYTKANLTAATNLSVTGTAAAAGQTVDVTVTSTGGGSPVTGSATSGVGGAFGISFAPSALTDGTLTVTATSTDGAGNTSAASTPATTQRDTVIPSVTGTSPVTTPTAGGSEPSQTGGVANGFTALANDDLGSASTIVLKDSTNQTIAVTKDFPSASSVRVRPSAGPLAPGSYTATVTLVDDVGNAAAPFTRGFTIDDTAPTAPSFDAPAVINVARSTAYTVTGTGEAGATVTLSFTDLTPSVLTSTATVAGNGTWSVTRSVASLVDGTIALAASQADAAGNASGAAAASTTKDTVIPRVSQQNFTRTSYAGPPPVVVTVVGKVDNGASTTGEADTVTVTVTDTGSGSVAAVGIAGSDGMFSIPVTVTSLLDGTLTAHVVASDAAGNPSAEKTATTSKDTGAPATPLVTVTNPVNAANKANVAATGAAGASEAGSTVTVTIDDLGDIATTAVVGTATAAGNGSYAVSPLMNLTGLNDGLLVVKAQAADAAGNLSGIRTITVTKDTSGPAAPVVTFPTYVTPANVAAVPVSGTAESGASVLLHVADSGSGTVDKTVTATGGSFSTTMDLTSLAQGALTLTSTPTDVNGNPGDAAVRTSTKDTVAPGAPASVTASPSPLVMANSTSALTVSGTDALGDRTASNLVADITVSDTAGGTDDLVALAVPVAVTSGAFEHVFPNSGENGVLGLADGTLTVRVVVRDPAGNLSSIGQTTLVKDVTPLAITGTTPADLSSSQSVADITVVTTEALVTGTSSLVPPYSSITVTNGLGNGVLGSIVFLAGNKGMRFTPSSPFTEAGSPYTVTAHATDANDTADTVDQTTTFSVDVTAPVAPTVTTVTDPVNAANKSAVSVTGNATEAGLTVTVTISGTSGTPVTKAATSGVGGAYTVTGIDVSGLADGLLNVTAASTDGAGNAGPASGPAATTTKDATAPVVSPFAATATDYGHPFSGVSGTVSEAVVGSSVGLSASDGTHVVTGSAPVAANRTFGAALDLRTLSSGTVTFTASVLDAAGNAGTATTTAGHDAATPPPAPAPPTAVARDRAAWVAFAAPTSNGGASITSYKVTSSPDGKTATGSSSPLLVTGLRNGVTYTFTVTAINRVGGTTSAASNSVKPMGSSTVTLAALPSKVVAGTIIKLSGKLTRTDPSVAAAQVVVKGRYDNGTVVTIARVTPSSTGAWTYSVKAAYNRYYAVSYPGDTKTTSSASFSRRVLAAAKVTAAAPRGSHTVNQVITGSVYPNKRGKTVTLYRVTSAGALVKLATATLTSTSTYRFSVRLPAGYTTLRVAIASTPNNVAGFRQLRAYRT